VSVATISRHLAKAGLVVAAPKKRPKSSYTRFAASLPNETWQSDFTHYPLSDGTGTEILTWLDDCTRYALHLSAHHRVTGPVVLDTFRETAGQHGIPASTLTDNGMVFTTRLSGGKGGRNAFEHQRRSADQPFPSRFVGRAGPTRCGGTSSGGVATPGRGTAVR
jgi:hypothetical protein